MVKNPENVFPRVKLSFYYFNILLILLTFLTGNNGLITFLSIANF